MDISRCSLKWLERRVSNVCLEEIVASGPLHPVGSLAASSVSQRLFQLPCERLWSSTCLFTKAWPTNWGWAQLEEQVPSMQEASIQFPVPRKLGLVARACNRSTGVEAGRSGVHSHPQRHNECEPSLRVLSVQRQKKKSMNICVCMFHSRDLLNNNTFIRLSRFNENENLPW